MLKDLLTWWALTDSNRRPSACKADALNQLHIRPEEILRLTKLDPHSLGKWRVDGALPHIQNWYEAFNITEHDPMFVAKDKRVSIW